MGSRRGVGLGLLAGCFSVGVANVIVDAFPAYSLVIMGACLIGGAIVLAQAPREARG